MSEESIVVDGINAGSKAQAMMYLAEAAKSMMLSLWETSVWTLLSHSQRYPSLPLKMSFEILMLYKCCLSSESYKMLFFCMGLPEMKDEPTALQHFTEKVYPCCYRDLPCNLLWLRKPLHAASASPKSQTARDAGKADKRSSTKGPRELGSWCSEQLHDCCCSPRPQSSFSCKPGSRRVWRLPDKHPQG